tara:strand:- start:579 stop:779 length:201 start_codon:yes stop_codon:yes gene_type:complete
MFKIVVIAILLINSIFWGFYPSSSVSIHQKIVDRLGLNIKLTYIFNIFIGLFFYILAILVSHNVIV